MVTSMLASPLSRIPADHGVVARKIQDDGIGRGGDEEERDFLKVQQPNLKVERAGLLCDEALLNRAVVDGRHFQRNLAWQGGKMKLLHKVVVNEVDGHTGVH